MLAGMTLDMPRLQTGEQPNASVVVLHRLSADGVDSVPIPQNMSLSAVGPTRFVFTQVPVRPVRLNGGRAMCAWYATLCNDLVHRKGQFGQRASDSQVQALLDREVARGIVSGRTVLMGFSRAA